MSSGVAMSSVLEYPGTSDMVVTGPWGCRQGYIGTGSVGVSGGVLRVPSEGFWGPEMR